MRALLGFLLVLASFAGAVSAHAQEQPAPSMLQRVGIWGQQLAAAQQPVADEYRRCTPVLERIQALFEAQSPDKSALREQVGSMQECIARMKEAGASASNALRAMGPMPAEIERGLHLDSRDVLRRSAESVDNVGVYLDKVAASLTAAVADDRASVKRYTDEARALAGSMFDGQLALLETLRSSLPMQVHKSMLDVRIGLTRAFRVLAVADPRSYGAETGAQLHAEGVGIANAAAALRGNWKRERPGIRLQMPKSGGEAMIAAVDTAFDKIAAAGERAAADIAALAPGPIRRGDAVRIMRSLAEAELAVLAAGQEISAAVSRIG